MKMTIRFKLVVWYTGMLLLLLGVFSSFVYVYMSNLMFQGERSLLKAHAAQVSAMISITKSSIRFEGFRELYRIVNSGTLVAVFDMYGGIVATSGMPSELLKLFPRYGAIRRIKVRSERWLVYDVVKRQHDAVVARVRCARPLKLMNRPMENLKTVMFIAIPIILLIAIAGGLFLANRALSPIDNIIATTRAIGRDDLSKRIQVTNSDDEIGRLATTFNEMLDRLEDAFKKERQFTSDASHELRTPVTIISATAEEALSGSKDIEEYKSSLGVILRESNRMAHLISQLLMLSKADEKSYKLELEEVDISEMIEGVIEEFSDIAEKRGVRVEFDGLKGAKIKADQS
ncbi:MAG: HAMP domain-containing protein, partial [Synergistetes bacterium]|nr:HAMP domain-containing protein [Synergistota bacterium]